MIAGALSCAALALGCVSLLAARSQRSPALLAVRWASVALTAVLVGLSFVGWVTGWALLLGGVGFVLSVHGLALAIYARRERGEEAARRWSEFERAFHLYARRQADWTDAT
jgi:hypothetical protein